MKIRELGVLLLIVCFICSSVGIEVYAAEIGEQLLEPESGWKRYDERNPLIVYEGIWVEENINLYLDNTNKYTEDTSNGKVKIKFKGTKFRIMSNYYTNKPDEVKVKINGVIETYNPYGELLYKALQYEKTDLPNTIHQVEIWTDTPGRFDIDAIDIDKDGELLDIYTPTNLKAVAGDEEVGLSWDEVEDADSYIIKRSTTKGGPYETEIVDIDDNYKETSYIDEDVENGTTYYYVVSAVIDGDESDDSNEASATPEGSSSGSGDKAILKITMQNGKINEYDLSMDDVEDFIDWFEDQDDPYYIIEKEYNIGPFESRKDYIVADKILQFEVMEYED